MDSSYGCTCLTSKRALQQEQPSPQLEPATVRPEETPPVLQDLPTRTLARPPLQLETAPSPAPAQARWFIRVFEQDVLDREDLHYVEVTQHPSNQRNWISPAMVQRLHLTVGEGQRFYSLVYQGVSFRSNKIVRVSWVGKDTQKCRRSEFSIAESGTREWPFQLLVGGKFLDSFGGSSVFFREPQEGQ